MNDQIKTLCLLAVTLVISGCSGSGDDEGTDVQLQSNDPIITDVTTTDESTTPTTTEVADVTVTSDATAVPVTDVSSAQMDAYIDNPLLTSIPAELSSGVSGVTADFIINPLIN